MDSERREKPRYEAHTQTFFVLRPHFTTVEKLIGISARGLAFNYIALDERKEGATHLDVFRSDHDFSLSRVQCKIICETKENETFYFESRRCGVQFGELTYEQAAQLEDYLKHLGTGKE